MGKDLKGKELGQGICQLQDGRYMARYTNRHGKRISLYSLKLKELRDMKRKAEYEDRLGGGELINKDIYLRDVYKEWIKKKSNEIRPTTLYIYKNNYNTYIKPFETYIITNINLDVVEEFIDSLLDKQLLLSSILNLKAVFSSIMDFAVQRGYCIGNPFKKYKIPKFLSDKENKRKLQEKSVRYLTKNQRENFLKYIENKKRCHLKYLFKFLMYTGLRIGEAIALKWKHVNFENKTISIQDGYVYFHENGIKHIDYNALPKTNSSVQKIPMNDDAFQTLQYLNQCNNKSDEFVFVDTRGNPLTYMNVYETLKHLIKKFNDEHPDDQLPNFSPHWFRHTFATMCLENNMNPKAMQYCLRHAHLSITMDLYSHVSDNFIFDEITKLNNKLV